MFLEKAYSGNNHWGRYIITIIITFVAIQLAGIPLMIYMMTQHPGGLTSTAIMSAATSTNTGLALTLITFMGGFFALLFCVKKLHGKKYSDIITGRRKIDYKRIFFGAGIWAILSIAVTCFSIITAPEGQITFQLEPLNFLGFLIVALIFFPFQTTFEELMFRGYLMQGTGLLFKYRWIPFVLTSMIFGLMHASNPEVEAFGMWVALPQYILMGLILGYITVKDDGLELAIGMHAANNIVSAISVTSAASAIQTPALFRDNSPEASHIDTLTMLIAGVIFIIICNRKYHFMRKINLWGKIDKTAYTTEEATQEREIKETI